MFWLEFHSLVLSLVSLIQGAGLPYPISALALPQAAALAVTDHSIRSVVAHRLKSEGTSAPSQSSESL